MVKQVCTQRDKEKNCPKKGVAKAEISGTSKSHKCSKTRGIEGVLRRAHVGPHNQQATARSTFIRLVVQWYKLVACWELQPFIKVFKISRYKMILIKKA